MCIPWTPVVGDDGEVAELVGTHIDITEQRLAKEALEKLLTKSRSPRIGFDW